MIYRLPDRNKLLKAVALVVVCLTFSNFLVRHITYSSTPSLSKRFFLLNRYADLSRVKDGDIVRFPFSGPFVHGSAFLLKRVGCSPGESLTVDANKYFYCDGRYLGKAKDMSSKGEPVDHFRFNGVIPAGKFFAIADHRDSYDSRYFGLVDLAIVQAKAYPLF